MSELAARCSGIGIERCARRRPRRRRVPRLTAAACSDEGRPVEPSLGLVLSGGAARGAYEAGVMRFVLGDLARRLGRETWPEVVSGTSVGALNGVFAAARDAAELRRISELWQTLRIEQVYRLRPGRALIELLSAPRRGGFALLDPAPLARLVAERFPVRALRKAIGSRLTRAFIVAATEVATGLNAIFVDSAEGLSIPWQPGSRVHHEAIGHEHCRASAAIPFMFPSVAIGGRHHVDGGLRQNTPLRPVLAAGVDRALIVSVKQVREKEARLRRLDVPGAESEPSPLFLAGKMLNALMLDPIERDLWSAEYRNQVVAWGVDRYGEGFEREAAAAIGLRHVDIVHLWPSQDLGELAGRIYRERPPKTSRSIRFLLDRIVEYTHDLEADFLSYLYFDRAYTGALEALGYEDARRREEEIARLILRS